MKEEEFQREEQGDKFNEKEFNKKYEKYAEMQEKI